MTTATATRTSNKQYYRFIEQNNKFESHHAFLYFSLPLLHDYAVEMPNFLFCGGREPKATTFFYNSTREKIAKI